MKRKITLSIALVLSIVSVLLTNADSRVQAQRERYVADAGFISLGPNQILRVTVSGSGNDTFNAQFRRMNYGQLMCNGGVCKHAVSSIFESDQITLTTGEAASFDITPMPNSSGVRAVVRTNNRNAQVNTLIIDAITGQVMMGKSVPVLFEA